MKTLSTLVLLFLLSHGVQAQSTTGSLEGWIVDTTGAPIPGANIAVASDVLQGMRGGVSDAMGHYRLLALPPGEYVVNISHVTSHPVRFDNIRVYLGRATSLGRVALRERLIELQGIEVTEKLPLIDPRSTMAGVNLPDLKFKSLPIDRNYLSLLQLAPQASPSFYGDGANVSGATGLENRYFINGVDVTDAYRGISATQLPYNFVREVEVRSGAYEAEYQSALGGVVNVVTYSGGNQTHGEVFGFFTNNRFAGNPRMAAGQPALGVFTQYDMGLSIGGPIVPDRLWYFAAYNPQRQIEDVPVIGQSNQTDLSTMHAFAAKLSWAPDESNLVTLSVMGDPTLRRGVGVWAMSGAMYPGKVVDLNSWLSDIEMGGTSLALSGTHIVTSNLLLESALSLVTRKDEYNPVGYSEPYQYLDVGDSVYGYAYGGTFPRSYERTTILQASIHGTLTLERHSVKAGIEFSNALYHSDDVWHWLVRLPDASYLVQLRDFAGAVSTRNPSVFIQDSWRIAECLTVNGGLRWDPQFMYASDNTLGQKILGTLAPRFGIVYQPGHLGLDRLLASAGRFYQPLNLCLTSTYHNRGVQTYDIWYPRDPRVDTSGMAPPPAGYVVTPFGNVRDLKGQYYDEVTLGYEREIGTGMKAGVRLMYRRLGEAIEDGYSSTAGRFVYGNPGSGLLAEFPQATREYKALELSLERSDPSGLTFQLSYVLSRNYGNYEGLADASYFPFTVGLERWPNVSLAFTYPSMMANAIGLLPDDRTHALKFFCSYPMAFGLTIGASGFWTSGTPVSELGVGLPNEGYPIFLRPRGTLGIGRTPAVWDLSLRCEYDVSGPVFMSLHPRFILDVFHVFSQKKPVVVDYTHYLGSDWDGNQIGLNPNYLTPLRYQPPMSMRLGLEVNF
jgi:hypothetical protein